MRRYLILLLLLFGLVLSGPDAHAQKKKRKVASAPLSPYDVDTLKQRIPKQRELFHTYINRQQDQAQASDGNPNNGIIYFGSDEAMTNAITKALITDIDHMQIMIENLPSAGDAQLDNQVKIRYLAAVRGLLERYNRDTRVDPYSYRRQVANLRDMIIAHHEGKLDEFARSHANVASVENSGLLDASAKGYVYKTVGTDNPKLLIRRLGEFANEPFACDVIAAAARVVPNEVFNYATSTNYTYSNAVKRCNDPLVQTIVKIASQSKTPLKAMPFLSDIHSGKRTVAEVDKITSDPDLFFKALVELKVNGETLGGDTYTQELQYRGLKYVRTINDLHESPDPVRFKVLEGFTPEQLYFIMVYGQDELYTSSFLGAFKRMMERLKGQPGDSLLERVRYDRFRTFIRLCAGYNTLGQFLATIDEGKKNSLMHDFITGLEKGSDEDLEDAVDVADAFSSIEDPGLTKFLEEEVRTNYERCKNTNARKGIIVYGLLSALFKGGLSGNEVGLPPVTFVPFSSLEDDSGTVYQQVFFYGDEDGKMSFQSFLTNFKDGKWKVQTEKYWTMIRNTSGKPIVIYANNPIPEPGDEEAQGKLKAYLTEKGIHPAIVIHRGHSYHLPLTMEGLQKETKVVMLGSCGGYHNLGTVLDRSPDAQIISTKQTGTMSVNEPIVQAINAQLLEGKNIDWTTTWKGLGDFFTKKGGDPLVKFRDYVPPHKNLGAIFIKAYRKLSNSES
jgi:hypothetical protein